MENMMQKARKVFEKTECCACGKPVIQNGADITLKIVMLNYKATWNFPTWGFPADNARRAAAVICDTCLKEGRPPVRAIEIDAKKRDKIKYHALKDLEHVPPQKGSSTTRISRIAQE